MKDYLLNQGYNALSDNFYDIMNDWFEWYKGKNDRFHSYSQFNGKRKIKRERYSLGMAKKVCEDWANILLNEKVNINISDERISKVINKVLEKNNFRVRSNRLLEQTFALGTGAFVEYLDKGEIKIDYIRGNMIYPLSWENGVITECAFAGEKYSGGKTYTYLNTHTFEKGQYVVRNKMFLKEKGKLTEIKLPDGIVAEFRTGSTTPLFQIITPNIINNIDPDNPMGISIFANCIDLLKSTDLIFDSYTNEFRLGKKRIIVPTGMAQIHSDSNGITPIFDDNDTEFYAINDRSLTDMREINMELRADAHEKGLQKMLDLLSYKCGLGSIVSAGKDSSIKTATEIKYNKSELFQNMQKHELILERALKDLINSIAQLMGISGDFEVSISFDDSIIDDVDTLSVRAVKEFETGIIDEAEYLKNVYGYTENQATDLVKMIKKRQENFSATLKDDSEL
ncbi:MAG: phage portal protein [Eubacteriales bacterium]|nr:phage portal protein [Eubacteriales bacterium]